MRQEIYKTGETIFSEGDRSEYAYIIESGRVEILDGRGSQAVTIATLEPGEIFGEMGILDEMPRSRGARAQEDVILRPMDQQAFVRLLRDEPDESLRYIRTLFDRLRSMNLREPEAEPASTAAGPGPSAVIKLYARGPGTSPHIPEEGITVSRLPYNVGRRSRDPLCHNHLDLPDEKPFTVSRDHFAIDRRGPHLMVRDRGSYLGLRVNGEHIGGGIYKTRSCTLKPGSNEILLGKQGENFGICVVVEAEPAP